MAVKISVNGWRNIRQLPLNPGLFKNLGSGVLSDKMLLVRIVKNNEIRA